MFKFSVTQVPDGYQFRPTTDQIFSLFLVPIVVYGDPLPPDCPFLSLEIYGENKEPWKIFNKDSKGSFWVFTRLRKKSKSRINRTAGCGCWLVRNMKEIYDNHGRVLGYDKYFVFTTKNVQESKDKGHWIMHEYSLEHEDKYDRVICQIRNKDVKDSDIKSNNGITVNMKPNDEGMKSVPKCPVDHDHEDTNDCHNSKQSGSLNLKSKSNDEDTKSMAESSNQEDSNDDEETTMLLPDLNDNAICEIRNTDAASLDRKLNTKRTRKQMMSDEEKSKTRKQTRDDEEMESIPKTSPNCEDYGNANDDVNTASDEVDKIIIEGHSDEGIKQNSELFGDANSLSHVLRKFINEADKFDYEIVLKALENSMGADSATLDLDLEGETPPTTEMVNCEDGIGFNPDCSIA